MIALSFCTGQFSGCTGKRSKAGSIWQSCSRPYSQKIVRCRGLKQQRSNMKQISILLLAIVLLSTNALHAQSSSMAPMKKTTASNQSDEFAWGICVGALAVLGTIVGLTAASASATPPTYSNPPKPTPSIP